MASVQLKGFNDKIVEVKTGLFINNEFVPAKSGATIDLENPATGKHLATVSAAQKEDIDAAVDAAEIAFQKTWKSTLPERRAALLLKLADLIERDQDELASIEAVDAGVLFMASKHAHVPLSANTFRYFAGWCDKIDGTVAKTPEGLAYTQREPLGVCGAIIPWNAPLMIASWKLSAALAAGNTIILKPPELAPLFGQKLAELVVEAGFPPGVVNIVCGNGRPAGQALAEHMKVRKVSFTGSGVSGREVLKASANSNLKRVTLELGGKGPSIVFPDADMDNAVLWCTLGITLHNGQICAAGSRIYVHSSIYDSFLKAFSARSANAVHGDPLLPETTKGPLISGKQHAKVVDYIKQGKTNGIRILHGGEAMDGYYVPNTAFAEVPENESIMKEEIFGPVASIAKFDTEAEVIAKANDTEYGLNSAIFTNDVSRAHRVAAALEAGTVTINSWGTLNHNTPFGGVKQSGFGKDLGPSALDGWTSEKVVKFNLLPGKD